jgi:hypothetical protein
MQEGSDQVPEESLEDVRQHDTSLSMVPKGRPVGLSEFTGDVLDVEQITRYGRAALFWVGAPDRHYCSAHPADSL